MNLNNILKMLAISIVAIAIGGVLGYTFAPDKVVIQEKIIEKTIVQKDEKTTKKYDKDTGKLIEETKETKQKETNVTKTDKSTEKTKSQKMYSVKAGVGINPRSLSDKPFYRVGSDVKIPVFPVYVGAEVDLSIDKPLTSLYLRMEF